MVSFSHPEASGEASICQFEAVCRKCEAVCRTLDKKGGPVCIPTPLMRGENPSL